jgi:hypothetical protein
MPALHKLAHLGVLAAAALTLMIPPWPPQASDASSHRDAPLITEDPLADNTDVYAFVSPARPDAVTLIANYIPLEEPGEGPNHYRFSDSVLYEIMVDTDGDGKENLTYQFEFKTKIGAITPNTFLYNTGVIGLPPNPSDPTSQYTNLNVQQSYTLSEVRGPLQDRRLDPKTVLLQDARVAPIRVGPKSLLGSPSGDTTAAYTTLANAAIHTIGSGPEQIRVFAGPRDEGFYVDLMGSFDLINIRNPGVDTTSGFNVHTIALEIPKSRFEAAGAQGIIGVWASASRRQITTLRPHGEAPASAGLFVQVSRLGNPLVNEVLIPLRAKDRYNATHPKDDAANIRDFVVNPGTTQGAAALIPILNSLTGCTPVNGRVDLELALLKGIDKATAEALASKVPSLKPFADAGGNQLSSTPVVADMIRLNYKVPPSASPNRLGFFGGDPAGFPNGRRVGDDVLDIDLKAAAGGVLHVLGVTNCPVSLTLGDNVDSNDVPYLAAFPYLATPHEGYRHAHDHD